MSCAFPSRIGYLLLLLPSVVVIWESVILTDVSRRNQVLCHAFLVRGTRSHSPKSRVAGFLHRPTSLSAMESRSLAKSQSRPSRIDNLHLALNNPEHTFDIESSRNKASLFTKVLGKRKCLLPICLSATEVDDAEKSEQEKRSFMRRLWSGTFGRVWRTKSNVAKILLKPARYLKSLLRTSTAEMSSIIDEDEGTYITQIENLATVEEVDSEEKGGEEAGTTPTVFEMNAVTDNNTSGAFKSGALKSESETKTEVQEEQGLDFIHVEDIMQKAQVVADIAKEAVMTSLQVPVASEEPKVAVTLEKEQQTPDTATMDEAAKEDVVELLPPKGERWAVSASDVDLTGKWKIVVTDEFKQKYDSYLKNLGQPMLVRSIALSIIGLTAEETKQSDRGRLLWIKGTNTRGIWERTLHASGSDFTDHVLDSEDFEHRRIPIVTADSEEVEAEAWWENNGTVHRSWLRGGKKYGGGDFESRRFLSDENTLVCETTFHPKEYGRDKAKVTWTFQRE